MSESFDVCDEEPRSQRGKWMLVAGLGVVLIGLNVMPDGPKAAPPVPDSVAPVQVAAGDVPQSTTRRTVVWPELPFDDVIRSNPFRMNQSLLQALGELGDSSGADSVANNVVWMPPRQLDAQQYPVRMIFEGPQGRAALIGDRICAVGDEIDGMQVVSIESDGVKLAPLSGSASDVPPPPSTDAVP